MPEGLRAHRLVLAFSVAMFLAVGLYWYRLEVRHQQMQEDVLVRTQQVAQQLVNGVSEQMEAVLRSLDFVSLDLREGYVSNPSTFDQSVRIAGRALPPGALLQVSIVGSDGYLRYSNIKADRVFLGDREHFKIHAEHRTADRLFVSVPTIGRVSGRWSIQFSRPVIRHGQFDGVIVLSIAPEFLSVSLENLELGSNDSAGFVRWDGSYLARSSEINGFLGKKVKSTRPYLRADAATTGVFVDESTFEPIRRMFAWHRLPNYPQLTVYVGLSENDVLAPIEQSIRDSRGSNFLGSTLVLVFSVTIGILIMRTVRQRNELANNEAMYRDLFEKNTSVKLLVDAESKMIVSANQAALDFYGYTSAQFSGMNINDINCLAPDEIRAEMDQARALKRTHFIFPHRLASGEIRQVEVYSGPVERNGRELLYSIVHDITDRLKLESKLKDSEERYRTIFAAIPEGMILISCSGEIVMWNQAALRILGVSELGLKDRRAILRHKDGYRIPMDQYPTRQALGNDLVESLYMIEAAEGNSRWISVDSRRFYDQDGKLAGAVIAFSDVSRLVGLEESMLISQSVFDASTEGILVTDHANRIVSVNGAFTRITGYTLDEIKGRTPAVLSSGHHERSFYQDMFQQLEEKGWWEGDITNRRKNGSVYVERLKISAVRNQSGLLLRYVAMISDITKQKKHEQDIWQRAHYDALTQLPNRALLMERLGQALMHAERSSLGVGLLFIDLDKFKPVNDKYGHQAGDELLRLVAARIEDILREEDTVARLGGDEFVVLLTSIHGKQDCWSIAEKILTELSTPFELREATVEISASIGIALSPTDGITADALMKSADLVMYQAKAAGRGTICSSEVDNIVWAQSFTVQ